MMAVATYSSDQVNKLVNVGFSINYVFNVDNTGDITNYRATIMTTM